MTEEEKEKIISNLNADILCCQHWRHECMKELEGLREAFREAGNRAKAACHMQDIEALNEEVAAWRKREQNFKGSLKAFEHIQETKQFLDRVAKEGR